MLHIILLILKIIGIILLCILGIVLFAVLCALFVPLRYRIRVVREAGEGKPPVEVTVKLTWFLHLINILIRYPADVILRVRIMVITLFRLPKKEKSSGKNKKNKKKKKNTGDDVQEEDALPDRALEDEIHSEPANPGEKSPESGTDGEEEASPEKCENEAGEEEDSSRKDSLSIFEKVKAFIEKIKSILQKIKEFFENIQYTIRNLCDKIKSTLDNIQYYREVLTGEPFQQSFRLCKNEIGYVMRKVKPDKFEADLVVGMEDPAALGEIFALYGMLYPVIGQHIRIVGEFESGRTHVEGELYVRGRIRAFTFLRVAVRVYLNKDVRKLIRLLKKEAV